MVKCPKCGGKNLPFCEAVPMEQALDIVDGKLAEEGFYETGSSGFPSEYCLICLGCGHEWRPRQATVDKILNAHLEQ